ncbi:hypothetical protein [Actinoplanes derwentensis]|uniref:Uncharacterized protein n=1 Tax=Actinoplanes derwentensis TaxID=113562 RepID=A0A1H1XRS7_9ACTN|nr:hypothetical protein [Actinoplanes derwentensis]GID89209.1 hypothetical protein Ade03nite_81330 [Actinoplanes derwentensis]SDT11852.1 hypothetical protein SAMN04489716_2562 [Actinoplanes derwentensis]
MIDPEFSVDNHQPDRTSWTCRSCGASFPCAPARQALREHLGSIPLAMFMWAALRTAVADLGDGAPPAEDLYARFIRCTRTGPPGPSPRSKTDPWHGYHTVVAALNRTNSLIAGHQPVCPVSARQR